MKVKIVFQTISDKIKITTLGFYYRGDWIIPLKN